ncbi:MAG: histidinol-phosphatase [Desulfobacterales bacterium]|nr:histidinol-phosphatase [Desulfobacterales bacterium]
MHHPAWVSVHGGHSREFCAHAADTLDQMIGAYIDQGYAWVGITEHMPPVSDRFRYPDEVALGLTVEAMHQRFARYMALCRQYQARYADRITIFVGFETETYSGAIPFVKDLRKEFSPDYIVGSVHHVANMPIDTCPADYQAAAESLGGVEALYLHYFDEQLEMIDALAPAVVGHFDLVRIFDTDYGKRFRSPAIQARVRRNLERIRDLGLILDLNLAALSKGATEPYLTEPILLQARELGIPVVPGDDAHSIHAVGRHMDDGIARLMKLGFDTSWTRPA